MEIITVPKTAWQGVLPAMPTFSIQNRVDAPLPLQQPTPPDRRIPGRSATSSNSRMDSTVNTQSPTATWAPLAQQIKAP